MRFGKLMLVGACAASLAAHQTTRPAMDAFTRVPFLFGTYAATLESDAVWSIVTANPKMHGAKALLPDASV